MAEKTFSKIIASPSSNLIQIRLHRSHARKMPANHRAVRFGHSFSYF